MRISPLIKVLGSVVAVLIALALLTPGSTRIYASVLADVSPSPEPATLTPRPNDTPQPSSTPPTGETSQPSETTQPSETPKPSSTPPTGETSQPSETTQPGETPRPTNTRKPDEEGTKKGVSISIQKTISTKAIAVGSPIEFTLVVNNTGDETAQNVVVTDPLPTFLQLTGATADRGNVALAGNTVTVTIGPVGPGNTVTIHITALLVTAPRPPENSNIATLTTTSKDDTNDNVSRVEVRFPGSNNGDSSTAVPPTDTAVPGAPMTPVPGQPVTATPQIPASLPPTGDTGAGSSLWIALALIGAFSIAGGALLRRKRSVR